MRVSLDEFPHCKHHGLIGYEYDTVEKTFHSPFNDDVGGINHKGYYEFKTDSKTEFTASGNRRAAYIRRSQVVYWLEHGLPADWVYQNKVFKGGLVIDHINRSRSDDRVENLRMVSQAENIQNSPRSDRINDPEFRKLIAQRYDAGASRDQVAKRYQTHIAFVRRCVLEFGYKMRAREYCGILAKRTKQFIIDKRAEGWRDSRIARELGALSSSIQYFRKRHGIK